MATAKCEIAGFEGVTVEWPDEFTNWNDHQFAKSKDRAFVLFEASKDGDGKNGDETLRPSGDEAVLFGVLGICTVSGLDIDTKTISIQDYWKLPLRYGAFTSWLINTVWVPYLKAKYVPKNS